MTCTRCSKRLSRKTARIIEGKPVCSTCLFPELKGPLYDALAEDDDILDETAPSNSQDTP